MRNYIGFMSVFAVAAALSGCGETYFVAVPTPAALPVTPELQACADHAAGAQKAAFGSDFNALSLNTDNLVLTAPKLPVGSQPVGAVYDGEGQWYGQKEYRAVRFHCMLSPQGQVVYSFVRAE
ncbi:MAG: hypothetical protein GC129_04590 [Proteobacteria bacterium]|nr:hypothetical protein [Pseudomonadota bacterium]